MKVTSSYMIDPPNPFASREELWAFLRRLRELDPEDPAVQDVRLAVGSCLVVRNHEKSECGE